MKWIAKNAVGLDMNGIPYPFLNTQIDKSLKSWDVFLPRT